MVAAAQPLAAEAGLRALRDGGTAVDAALACNAVLDGLWLEGSALPDTFHPDEILRLGLTSVGTLLNIDLTEFA